MGKQFKMVMILFWLGLLSVIVAQTAALDEEISRLRRELMQVQAERKRVAEEAARDRREFAEYVSRIQKRIAQIKGETDSIKAQTRIERARSDSLAALVASAQSGARQYTLQMDAFRDRLIASCDRAFSLAKAYPPMSTKPLTSALSYLRSELTAKSIDNVEGFNRLLQILRDMEQITTTIQISQGQPPVSELRGVCYSIRLGALFEAVVDARGTRAVLWDGYDSDASPRWRLVDDPVIAAEILAAINIREGKSLPAFVSLPVSGVVLQGGSRQ